MRTVHSSRQPSVRPQNWRIEQLPGLSLENQTQLIDCGITTTLQLLQNTKTLVQKQNLSAKLQIHLQYINKWVAMADLARIPNVGCEYCGLLLHAGIASVAQLAQMPLHRLHQQILRLQVSTLQRRDLCPSVDEVAVWLQQARAIAPH